jgi:hypothetical protein
MEVRNTLAAMAVATVVGTAPAALAESTYVVLVDASSSIGADDRNIYRESFGNVKAAMRPGDRIVIAAVGQRDRSDWVREIDAEMPKPTGRRFADEKRKALFADDVGKAFESVLERSEKRPDTTTRILDSIEASAQAFAQSAKSSKVLVVLSDMEETGRFDMPSGAKKDAKPPPELAGAKVYVAGAGGGRNYPYVEAFWKRYFGPALVQYGRYPARFR